MSENFYRVLHYASLFFFLSGLGISFFTDSKNVANKIISGVASLLILVAGMGLIAKALQIDHGSGWPAWIHAKITIWAILAIGGPVLAKRLSKGKAIAFYVAIVLATFAAYLAVFKPF
ncbi:MAG: SirB2 family protein [Halobacteriovoraceae bacterium]|nr:SirB2 family protein [Halobacteriovoraceae bacterium]